jgi:hypothetical protein
MDKMDYKLENEMGIGDWGLGIGAHPQYPIPIELII